VKTECDGSCIDYTEGKNGRKVPTGTRRYPLERLCCAVALLMRQDETGRYSTLRVIAAQIGQEYAQKVADCARDALARAGESRKRR
jgi:L-aminopeptidase/D-esterase-like protein